MIELKAKAYSPAHITGFFAIFKGGSTGAGINIEEGVLTSISAKESKAYKITIKVNGKAKKVGVSERTAKKIIAITGKKFAIEINHKTKLPAGHGLGTSGAMALSTSLALNKALEANLSREECIMLAAGAEIEEGTGLGDVRAESLAGEGILLGKKPYPSREAETININETHVAIAFFGPIETKKIIRNPAMKKKINKAGLKCMEEFEKRKSLGNFVKLCNRFSRESDLLPAKLEKIISKVPVASMSMLGKTLFIVTNNPLKAKKILKKYSKKVIVTRIAEKEAGLIQ